MAPKAPKNIPQRQTLTAKASSSSATAPVPTAPVLVAPSLTAESNKLFLDFVYCHDKLLALKDEVLTETDSKSLRELYGQLGNALVSLLIPNLRNTC